MLSNQAIAEFKQVWKEQFGDDISDERADLEGTKLVQFMKLIYKPIPKDKHKKYNP
jgi:hypothetical protein